MAMYELFDKRYPQAWVEQNIFDRGEMASWENSLEFPRNTEYSFRGAVEFVPTALMYQEDSDGLRFYVLHPITEITRYVNSSYHLVTVQLDSVFELKSAIKRTKQIYRIIREFEDRVAKGGAQDEK